MRRALKQPSAILLIVMLLLVAPTGLFAGPKVVPLDGISYNAQASMMDNLRVLTGKRVTLVLGSGKVMTGTVTEVGQHSLHLEKLQGKEYFDALIKIDSIEAMETRFRTPQR